MRPMEKAKKSPLFVKLLLNITPLNLIGEKK
jgi:hypothetical protein